ncbi:SprT family zinc-dependent metalloprotease [Maridesulfovibrio sp.]|uniref:M48 family metallopeptidase n=1 Tax=Maridesulfovibrio sp. TaxID=2795000 RepID=UPI0029C9FAFB|nr:SprT family zinc-dependent metalloprotease [Maridesulfovibrio sp.]
MGKNRTIMQTLTYGDEKIRYQVCHVPGKKTKVAIHVHPDGSVQVDAPLNAEITQIKEAVQKRARWVMEHLIRNREIRANVLPREYISGESYFYQGRRHQLKVIKNQEQKSQVRLYRGQLQVTTENASPERVKKLLQRWYKDRAKAYFEKRLLDIVSKTPWQSDVPQWRLLTMKKQWGSCSPKGTLSLNPHLVKAPRECIDYVLTHELCHLQEHNHSPRFYRLLTERIPEWKSVKAKLDGMSEMLLNE